MTKSIIKYFTYLLALQKCCKECDYTIHGLWIDYTRGGYPQFCNKEPYNESVIQPLKPSLDKYWESCWGDNSDLWEHEWKKHGTCFYPAVSVPRYFNVTLELYHKLKHKCEKNTEKDCYIMLGDEPSQ